MGDIQRRTGQNFVLLFPDDIAGNDLNGSVPTDTSIDTTGFQGAMWEDGDLVATDFSELEASPYNATVDNISADELAMYKLNINLPNRAVYELYIRHTSAMDSFRQEIFDLVTRAEALSVIRGNTRYTFSVAAVEVPARKVAVGVLDTLTIEHRYDGAADFSSPNLVSSKTLEFTFANLGDTNPVSVAPA